jgi:hypothetical protein
MVLMTFVIVLTKVYSLQLMASKFTPNKFVCNVEEDNIKCVAKLGYSWEAVDVRRCVGRRQLAEALNQLVNQRYSLAESVMVQEWVTFDVELRLFWIDPTPEWDDVKNEPKHMPCKKVLYTRFCRIDGDRKLQLSLNHARA